MPDENCASNDDCCSDNCYVLFNSLGEGPGTGYYLE